MTSYKDPESREARLARRLDRLIARFSDADRPFVARLARRRLNQGTRTSSVLNFLDSLLKADTFLQKPFQEATPEEFEDLIAELRTRLKASSVATTSQHIRTAWKALLSVERLPPEMHEATYVRETRHLEVGQELSPANFHALLEQASRYQGGKSTLQRADLVLAFLWSLWDTGFRARELLSLRIGDVRFDDAFGAQIKLRPDAPSLKTGPRTIYVSECVAPLRAWIGQHPRGHDARAPPSWTRLACGADVRGATTRGRPSGSACATAPARSPCAT